MMSVCGWLVFKFVYIVSIIVLPNVALLLWPKLASLLDASVKMIQSALHCPFIFSPFYLECSWLSFMLKDTNRSIIQPEGCL